MPLLAATGMRDGVDKGREMGLTKVLPAGGLPRIADGQSSIEPDGCYFANGLDGNPTALPKSQLRNRPAARRTRTQCRARRLG